jgi:hypothetical protein
LIKVPPGRKTHVRLMDDLGQTLAGPAKTARD